MKDATRQGIHLATKKLERVAASDDVENTFWKKELLGRETATALLHTVYYYNGKLFGLREAEQRNNLHNFELGLILLNMKKTCSRLSMGT